MLTFILCIVMVIGFLAFAKDGFWKIRNKKHGMIIMTACLIALVYIGNSDAQKLDAMPTTTPTVKTEIQKAEETKKEIYDAVTKDMTPKQLANKAYVAKQVEELTKENADNEALLKKAGDYETWIKTKLTGFDMHNNQLVDYVKERLKDPNSLEVVQTTHENNIDKGYIIVEMKFRAKNSFNAVVPGSIKAKFIYNTNDISIISFQS